MIQGAGETGSPRGDLGGSKAWRGVIATSLPEEGVTGVHTRPAAEDSHPGSARPRKRRSREVQTPSTQPQEGTFRVARPEGPFTWWIEVQRFPRSQFGSARSSVSCISIGYSVTDATLIL